MGATAIDRAAFARVHFYTLGFFACAAAVRIGLVKASGVPITWDPPWLFALITASYLAMGAFVTLVRFNPFIATTMNGFGLVLVGVAGSHALAVVVFYFGRGFPLLDAQFAAWDEALGFDWLTYLRWFDRHPSIDAMVQAAYQSIWHQPWLIVLGLAYWLQVERLYAMITAMVLALLATCMIATLWPALGAYEFYQISALDHPNIEPFTAAKMTEPIRWLRAAAWNEPMPPIPVGLISFPSFHSTAAVVYAWAAWRLPGFKWLFLIINAAMLTATPIHGSHYFVDIIAGTAVALVAIICSVAVFNRGSLNVLAKLPQHRPPLPAATELQIRA